jgi:uncharacterized Fe-S cluster-containing radical SAM superfamily protein
MTGIDAIQSAKGWRQKLVDRENRRFGLGSFTGTVMPDAISDIFRVFVPVNTERQRKLNCQYGHRLNIFLDSLFDYPTIIQTKLGVYGTWEQYNRLLTVQLGGCNFRCWYCYCDDSLLNGKNLIYLTPEELADKFVEQRTKDHSLGMQSNVLRISGGEPFLAPELILGCLEEIKRRRLDDRVFIWTETNLSPFLKESGSDRSLVENWIDLDSISSFRNFAVHPCVHGTTPENLHEIAKIDSRWFDGLLDGLKTLIQHKIDIYPTFSPNMCPPDDVESFFRRLLSINKNLPLRFALIEYHLDYPSVFMRLDAQQHKIVYNKYLVIKKWNELLLETYGMSYAEKPRQDVPL